MFGLMSNEKAFFGIFAELSAHIDEAAGLLQAMVEEQARPGEYASRIKRVEHQCDELTHELVRKLNSTFITPLDREDIYNLAVQLDDVVDLIDSTADRMVAFKVAGTLPQVHGMVNVLRRQTGVLSQAVSGLNKHDHILERCVEIHALENEADRLFHEGLVALFDTVRDPIELLKQKEIIEKIERATDKCEDVANVLEAIVLKSA